MSLRALTILSLSTTLGLAACGGREEPKAAAPRSGPARAVATAEVVRTGVEGQAAMPAIVQARRRATLSARMPASVTELPYREGQWVEAGAVVVRLDDLALRAAVAAAEAGLRAAQADLDRTKALLEKNAATPRELEQMTAQGAGAEARLTAAKDSLSYAVLRAPFAGRVASRRVNLGDVANPGMPLIEIEGQGGLEVVATVESDLAPTLRPGQRLSVLVDGQDAPLPATVTAVAPSGDPTTHRFEVKADVPSAHGLRAGLFARLVVDAKEATPRILVPASAVFDRGGLTGLFVVKDGRARLRWVAPGARTGETIEIRAGVEPGERVAVEPAGLLDGAAVEERAGAGSATARPEGGPEGAAHPREN
jgi:membrane fusion protein (multidrug efflux system)